MKTYLLSLNRETKRALLLVIDVISILFAVWLAFVVRADMFFMPYVGDTTPYTSTSVYTLISLFAVIITIPALIYSRLYRSITRYITQETYKKITIVSLVSVSIWTVFVHTNIMLPRSIYVLYFIFSTSFFYTSRFIARYMLIDNLNINRNSVLVYGSDKYAFDIAELLKSDNIIKPVGFISNKKDMGNTFVADLPVIYINKLEKFIKKKNVREILIAMPNPTSSQLRSITKELSPYELNLRILPNINLISQGKLKVSDVRKIDIDDLLGRDTIAPDDFLMRSCIEDKTILITGCGGSIGSELSRQIITLNPKKMVLIEQSEYFLYEIDHELKDFIKNNNLDVLIESCLGSVTDEKFIENIFLNNDINTVYHAAANKHVPLVEANPFSAIKTNIFGTHVVAKAAYNHNVGNFVLVSSDKAVRPTNIMGATKRFSELILQALQDEVDANNDKKYSTKFCMVRFGNVLDTSGSVVPLFRKQIASGGPLTVTDPNVIRYFMTIKESSELVIQAGSLSKGGDVFLLEMGDPINILDLAKQIVILSGKQIRDSQNPNGDIEIEFTGLRPGEKLYEELLIGDDVKKTKHKHIMTASEEKLSYQDVLDFINQFKELTPSTPTVDIQKILFDSVTGYEPYNNNVIDISSKVDRK